jgi:hypothetical protein
MRRAEMIAGLPQDIHIGGFGLAQPSAAVKRGSSPESGLTGGHGRTFPVDLRNRA